MCCVVLKRIYIYMYISMIQLYSQCWACVLACSPLALLTSSQQRIKIDFRKNWRWNAYTYNGNGGKKCEWNQNARATTTERKKTTRWYVGWIDLNILLIPIAVIMSWPKCAWLGGCQSIIYLGLWESTMATTTTILKKKNASASDEYFSIRSRNRVDSAKLVACTTQHITISCSIYSSAYRISAKCVCVWVFFSVHNWSKSSNKRKETPFTI